jgi:hypothetical protein
MQVNGQLPGRLGVPSGAAALDAIDGLIDSANGLEELEYHGLQLLASRRWRALGRHRPGRLVAQERLVAAITLATPSVLKRIRAAYDGELLLLKGPEVASTYPDPVLRQYGDLDLLAADSRSAQRALIAAGFEPTGDARRFRAAHHLQPLRLAGSPLLVEVHHAPNWPDGLKPPAAAELLELGIPARCGARGILGLPPAEHAMVLAAHSWAHSPLGNLRQLLDIALVAGEAAHADLDALASRWGVADLWSSTVAALNAIFCDAASPLTLRLWARHLSSVRPRTVFEAHLTSWLSPLWCFPGSLGPTRTAAAFMTDLRPLRGEDWRNKSRRTWRALINARMTAVQHDALAKRAGMDHNAGCSDPLLRHRAGPRTS